MKVAAHIWRVLTSPWRAFVAMLVVLVNLSARQMRSVFSLFMLAGIVALSALVVMLTNEIERSFGVGIGNRYVEILFWVVRFFCYLMAWFSGIMGLVVFGADWLRARYGNAEFGFGQGLAPSDPDKHQLSEDIPEEPVQ